MPKFNMTMEEAGEDLRGFEMIAIEKHYGCKFSEMYEGQQISGLLWVFECRLAVQEGRPKPTWQEVENLPLIVTKDYFIMEETVDPDSEAGKELEGSE